MGLSLSREIFSFFLRQLHLFLSNSFVWPRRSHSSAPAACSKRRRAQQLSRMARLRATALAARSVLDGREHGGTMRRLGAAHVALLVAPAKLRAARPICSRRNPRRARHWEALIARHSLVFGRSFEDRTMMQSCASAARLRGGGSILHSGLKAMVSTSDHRHLGSSSADPMGPPNCHPIV